MTTQYTQRTMDMTLQKTLTALCNKFITGLAISGISMSLAYAGYIGQDYNTQYDWCDPRFCCPPESDK
jgi:hypothetical protein